jgi:SAM-dependent methyltransferase
MILISLIFSLFPSSAHAERTNEEAFTEIYQHKIWGAGADGEGSSGGGSTLHNTKLYRQFLQEFLHLYQIQSVVDMGCGDWSFSQMIDWGGIGYKGYDVVRSLIAKNHARHATETIQFFHADAIAIDLPPADLFICKDVLQHLPNTDIERLIIQLPKFKYCLITNDVNPMTMSSDNPEIPRAWSRKLDLTQPPFSLSGTKVLTYFSDSDLKQVLLIVRPN